MLLEHLWEQRTCLQSTRAAAAAELATRWMQSDLCFMRASVESHCH